ncbi:hypothetical protein [uncultured Pseudokineococcus sp.]|uniref:hypothetical protein n=1 Tax=uncultured Pseudokineococcus sp. TaxID=1642928 RepID=UPI00260E11E1|nr:hypothetical protein [uncultured Pseudokineococcus sp.]
MDTDHPPITAQQARDQLDSTRTRSLGAPGDRRAHAIGAAAVGLTTGLHMATRNLVGESLYAVLSAVSIGVVIAVVLRVERVSRTVPRGARRWFWTGLATSFAVALGFVTPWLNLQAQDGPSTWPTVVSGAVVVAVPSLLAAAAIARSRP